jgi:hypothetical protein
MAKKKEMKKDMKKAKLGHNADMMGKGKMPMKKKGCK